MGAVPMSAYPIFRNTVAPLETATKRRERLLLRGCRGSIVEVAQQADAQPVVKAARMRPDTLLRPPCLYCAVAPDHIMVTDVVRAPSKERAEPAPRVQSIDNGGISPPVLFGRSQRRMVNDDALRPEQQVRQRESRQREKRQERHGEEQEDDASGTAAPGARLALRSQPLSAGLLLLLLCLLLFCHLRLSR